MIIITMLIFGLIIISGIAIQAIHDRDRMKQRYEYERDENEKIRTIIYGDNKDEDKISCIRWELEKLPF